MASIDWFYLRRPLIIFAVAAALAAVLIVVGRHFESAQYEKYQDALARLQSTHSLYRNIVNDIDLLEQYRHLYADYKSSGLVGKERRLSWIESLESTNEVLRLPTLTFSLKPQESFDRPGFQVKRGVAVQSSPMDLTMGLLHEEDLFALFEGLRLTIRNLFTVDACSISRTTNVASSLQTQASNLTGRCMIRWVTVDAS